MQIATTPVIDVTRYRNARYSDLSAAEKAEADRAMRNGQFWNPEWDQRDAVHRLTFKGVVDTSVMPVAAEIPSELFKFELVLNGHKFQVLLDQLLGINQVDDLTRYSTDQLAGMLSNCASYRLTCYCAYDAAHREYKRRKNLFENFLVEKREQARQQIRAERIADKVGGLRKEIGQITAQELDDWVRMKYTQEYADLSQAADEWESNEKLYLEFRDTLDSRAMHLQSMLKMSPDNRAHMVSDGKQQY